jgi:hypothetical protein
MLTPAEISRGQCGSCDAHFSASDLGPADPAARPSPVVATLVTKGPMPGKPPTSDNPYAAPEANFVAATAVPSTPAGSAEYLKACKEAPQLLFGLAALGGIATAIFLGIAFFGEDQELKIQMLLTGIEVGVIAMIFAGLGGWSLAQPFPATLVGLILYGLITVAALALDPASAGRGIIIRVIIIVLLVKLVLALSKGPRHA